MSDAVKLDANTFDLAFRVRTRMHTFWRVTFRVTLPLFVLSCIVRIIEGTPPTWSTVGAALWFFPTIGWVWDDILRRRLDKHLEESADV